ncbi:MAG TPA: CcoQ/FixQ family Cbb3-type cytochrome c oxidase assembly chaperone [Bacteroidota bacterium]|nr:CcoQ/FixQ family Cbb3-type cytochrome c oxidase assembly chaperone [Bacteroidota bacterium]
MFSQYLETIEGIASYPILSLLIFIPFFLGVLYHVLRMKKEDADKMSRLPLN